jgi:hypothetical protein
MTGGSIYGNRVVGGGGIAASAGGILANGAFQKNGSGIIYGSDAGDAALRNTTEMTGTVAKGAVVVVKSTAVNPGAENVSARDGTAGASDSLYVDCTKASNTAAGVFTVPDWAKSFWD